ELDYRAFGSLDETNSQVVGTLAARIRRRYTGQEWEAETGLYAYHARLYDPALARFLRPDPARQGASPYAYVGNDPVDFTDPTGEVRMIWFAFRTSTEYAEFSAYIFADPRMNPLFAVFPSSEGRAETIRAAMTVINTRLQPADQIMWDHVRF